jgi:hypothetical protein
MSCICVYKRWVRVRFFDSSTADFHSQESLAAPNRYQLSKSSLIYAAYRAPVLVILWFVSCRFLVYTPRELQVLAAWLLSSSIDTSEA